MLLFGIVFLSLGSVRNMLIDRFHLSVTAYATLAALLPLLLSAYLNQRLFRYDALSDHADAAEMKRIFEFARGRLFLLGLITAVMYFIPPFNLIAPVFSALAFIHLCLAELEMLRSANAQGRGARDEGRGVKRS
jgi:uncharacterized protein involved in cysteine biosynthesis